MQAGPKPGTKAGYRGRRRLPRLPGRRYARVVLVAMLGAVAVAAGSAAIPESASPVRAQAESSLVLDKLNALDAQTRAETGRASGFTADVGAPDVWVLPLTTYRFSSSFGWRHHPGTGAWSLHEGVDLSAASWAPIYAARAGTIAEAGWNDGGYGYFVRIDHGDGILTLYGHQAPGGIVVNAGQEVKAGQLIGHVGNTGDSYGYHLHFEIRINGVPINPVPYLQPLGVDLLRGTETTTG